MNFISGAFLLFCAVVLAAYYLTKPKYQWIVLLSASTIFYLLSGLKSVFYIATTALSVFTGALLIEKQNEQVAGLLKQDTITADEKNAAREAAGKRKSFIFLAVLLLNFGLLAVTKYLPTAVNGVLSLISSGSEQTRTFRLFMPLGMSFYTFQAVGYIIDVKRGKYHAERNFARFALFISFFPQIIQGPISRYDHLGKQLSAEHPFNYKQFTFGLQLMLWGYFKKLVIADRAAPAASMLFGEWEKLNGCYYIFAAIFYTVQIYADFSGGIDIARGFAECLGIELPLNFERPFFSRTLSEFWRRWHITLGNWMKDYVFYPISLSPAWARLGKWVRKHMGKNAGRIIPASLTAFIVFFIIGIWHGASLNYIAYGLYNAGIIAVGMLLEPFFKKLTGGLRLDTSCFSWRLFQMIRTTFITALGRVIAHAESFEACRAMVRGIFSTLVNPNQISGFIQTLHDKGAAAVLGIDNADIIVLCVSLVILLVIGILQERGFRIRESISRQNLPFRWVLFLSLIFFILVFGVYGISYNAESFIYGGF